MRIAAQRGALIVFEGCDRSGKTTAVKRLVDYLNDKHQLTKGQLISKCLFGVIVWTKKTTKNF